MLFGEDDIFSHTEVISQANGIPPSSSPPRSRPNSHPSHCPPNPTTAMTRRHHQPTHEPGIPSLIHHNKARWPSGLILFVKEFLNTITIFPVLDSVVRKGVGSNPFLVNPFLLAVIFTLYVRRDRDEGF